MGKRLIRLVMGVLTCMLLSAGVFAGDEPAPGGTLLRKSTTIPGGWVVGLEGGGRATVRDVFTVRRGAAVVGDAIVVSVDRTGSSCTVLAHGAGDATFKAGDKAVFSRHSSVPVGDTGAAPHAGAVAPLGASGAPFCMICGGELKRGIVMPRMFTALCEPCLTRPVTDPTRVENTIYPTVVHFTCKELDLSSTCAEPNLDLVAFNDSSLLGLWVSESPQRAAVSRLKIRYNLLPLDLMGVIVHEWTHAWHSRNDVHYAERGDEYREGLAAYISCLFYKHAGLEGYFYKVVLPAMPVTPYQSGFAAFMRGAYTCRLIKECPYP